MNSFNSGEPPRVTFESVVEALTRAHVELAAVENPSLIIAQHEPCYIKQNLHTETTDPLTSEILLIRASAAVGKSTLAKELSATCMIPLLDLSVVGVYTHSLRGIIGADLNGSDALDRFTSGDFPLIIDALDESRLVSGEKGFEDFLETTWSLLLTNRRNVRQPKLVLIGRPEACEMVEISLASHQEIRISNLTLEFFDRSEALALIDAQASISADPKSAYRRNPAAAELVIDSYFRAIADALGLTEDELWTIPEGRSFAGYAPVLAALGQLLAKTDNFAALNATFESTGAPSAWASIERIAEAVMKREHDKLVSNLRAKIGHAVPPEAYDISEQYALLIGYIQSGEFKHTSRIKMLGDEYVEYRRLAETWLGEHPFLAGRDPANSVLGAMILARGIVAGNIGEGEGTARLVEASVQPFLWRSFQSSLVLDTSTPIDGRCLGYLLASLSSDPVDRTSSVRIIGGDDESIAQAEIFTSDSGRHIVDLLPPIGLYGRVENFDVSTEGTIQCHGYERGRNTVVYLHNACITAHRIEFLTDGAVLEGSVWLDAREVYTPARINLQVIDAQVGWDGAFRARYPWNRQETSLKRRPGARPESSPLYNLLEGARVRLSSAGGVVLYADLSIANPGTKWFRRVFGEDRIRKFMELMVDHTLAKVDPFSVGGQQKLHLRLQNVAWEQLETEYLERTGSDERITGFLNDAEKLFPPS